MGISFSFKPIYQAFVEPLKVPAYLELQIICNILLLAHIIFFSCFLVLWLLFLSVRDVYN